MGLPAIKRRITMDIFNTTTCALLQGELKISIRDRRLKASFADDVGVGIELPAHIRVNELSKHDLLSWAAVAGCQLATKVIDRQLPQDVAAALEIVAMYAQGGYR